MLVRGPRHIRRVDPAMARLIAAVGPCRMPRRRNRYAALVRTIVGQQVSTSAGRAVFERIRAAAGGHVTAVRVARLAPETLRACGLSRQKLDYVSDLTDEVVSKRLRLDRLGRLDDEEVVAELTRIRGIGRWSAEMFLMFVLGRPDVLPVGDLGIQNGLVRVYGLRRRPAPARMLRIAEPWRPYRTVGCWYLWRRLGAGPW